MTYHGPKVVFFFYREKLVPYWLTRFWKIFFSGCQKVSGTRNLAIFFYGKVATGLTDSSQRLIFLSWCGGKKQHFYLLDELRFYTIYVSCKKFVPNLSFFVRFPGQKRFSHSKLKKYVPEFYTMYMSFQIFVAICGMNCRVCTHNVPFVSSASARPEFEYRSQSPADTVVVLHEIYFRHDKPS